VVASTDNSAFKVDLLTETAEDSQVVEDMPTMLRLLVLKLLTFLVRHKILHVGIS
jgi:hypothetical protein